MSSGKASRATPIRHPGGMTPAAPVRSPSTAACSMKASTSVVYMFSRTTFARLMPAPARTASRLSSASAIWAAMSPECWGVPSPSTAVCPAQTRTLVCPSTTSPWLNPNCRDHSHGFTGVRFMSLLPPRQTRRAVHIFAGSGLGVGVLVRVALIARLRLDEHHGVAVLPRCCLRSTALPAGRPYVPGERCGVSHLQPDLTGDYGGHRHLRCWADGALRGGRARRSAVGRRGQEVRRVRVAPDHGSKRVRAGMA